MIKRIFRTLFDIEALLFWMTFIAAFIFVLVEPAIKPPSWMTLNFFLGVMIMFFVNVIWTSIRFNPELISGKLYTKVSFPVLGTINRYRFILVFAYLIILFIFFRRSFEEFFLR